METSAEEQNKEHEADDDVSGQMYEEDQNKDTYEEVEADPEADEEDEADPEAEGEVEPDDANVDELQSQTHIVTEAQHKRRRGETKMKHIARDPHEQHHVDFTALGKSCGPGSASLSSYFGFLVREHVLVIIKNWKKFGEDIRTVLWKSIEVS